MPYTLTPDNQLKCAHLVYSGSIDFKERNQAKDEVFALCFKEGFHRSLIDLRDSDIQMSKSDVINFAESFKDTTLPDNYRVAGVITPENQSDNLIDIIVNMDGINIKYFFNIEDAKNWLTSI